MLVMISGCKDNPGTIASKEEGNIPVTVDDNAMNDFFGGWKITKVLPGYISGLTQEEADAYIGRQVTYMPSYCEYDGKILHHPHYKYEQLPTSEFIDGYKLSNEDWNIEEEYITRVEVYQDETQTQPWQEYVSSFYIIDSHLIINIEGDFFQMDRVVGNSSSRTIINPATVEIGQSIGGLTVSEIDAVGTGEDLQINDITFSGELTVTGTYEWEDTGDGLGYIITVDEEAIQTIPLFEDFPDEKTLVLSNTEEAKKLFSSSSGNATFVITNYSIGYRQIMMSADLVKVIE